MRKFAGKIQTKEVAFMDDKIVIRKLSTGSVRRIGKISAGMEAEGDEESLDILLAILNEGVVLEKDEAPIDADLLEQFPLAELNTLSTEIMKFAGVIEGNVA